MSGAQVQIRSWLVEDDNLKGFISVKEMGWVLTA